MKEGNKRPRQKSLRELQADVDRWNSKIPEGSKIALALDDGTIIPTITRSRAQILGGHSAVVWVVGKPGCYRLDRCTLALE